MQVHAGHSVIVRADAWPQPISVDESGVLHGCSYPDSKILAFRTAVRHPRELGGTDISVHAPGTYGYGHAFLSNHPMAA